MPRYAVRQPDGKLAIFSTVVDSFIASGLTPEEAIEYFRENMGRVDAEAQVRRGVEDSWEGLLGDPSPNAPPGLRRWTGALQTILEINGGRELRAILAEIEGAKPKEGDGA